jgi:hypothetical protein
VPCEFAGQRISARLYPERVEIVSEDEIVASHPRLPNKGQVHYDWQHYLPLLERKPGALRNGAPFDELPESLKRLRLGLLKREGGERVMLKVLAAVPRHGLEAVLVAVELVLDNGALSAEHIENVLSRLNHPIVQNITLQTGIELRQEPLADMGRYDSLRVQEPSHA